MKILLFKVNIVAEGDDTPRPTPVAQKPEPSVRPLDTLTRASSVHPLDTITRAPSVQPLDTLTRAPSSECPNLAKPRSGLAPTLNRLGFEPANFGNIADVSICITRRQTFD